MSQSEEKYQEMIQVLRAALVERRASGCTYREICDRILDQEHRKPFDRRNETLMIGIETLKENLRISTDDLRRVLLLSPIATNSMVPNGFIEKLELEISARMYINTERTLNDESNNRRRPPRLSRDQPQRINFRSRSHLRMRLSEQNPVIVIHSDSETETESESETFSVGCPKSVRDRMRSLLEPQIRAQIQREMNQQLRQEIQREMEPGLRAEIRREIEPLLREQILQEITPQLGTQIHRELEPQIREQIRREILPTRDNIEDEIREADEQRAWIEFLLYIVDEHEVDVTLDTAFAICEVCISPCMNRRPIILNCGHVFCGNCVRAWCYQNGVCPKCRTQIRFNHSVFKIYPTLDSI